MGWERTGCCGWGWGRLGSCRMGVSARPGWSLLSRSPGHDLHHGAAGVAGGGGGDAGVPDLLGDRPAGARLPVVLREAGGEVGQGPRAPSWRGGTAGWEPAPNPSAPSCLVGARSHGPGAGDRPGRPGGPARVVHLPGELRGRLRLLQVGPRPRGAEQQPQLRWAPSSASRGGLPWGTARQVGTPGWHRWGTTHHIGIRGAPMGHCLLCWDPRLAPMGHRSPGWDPGLAPVGHRLLCWDQGGSRGAPLAMLGPQAGTSGAKLAILGSGGLPWGTARRVAPWLSCRGVWACWGDSDHREPSALSASRARWLLPLVRPGAGFAAPSPPQPAVTARPWRGCRSCGSRGRAAWPRGTRWRWSAEPSATPRPSTSGSGTGVRWRVRRRPGSR